MDPQDSQEQTPAETPETQPQNTEQPEQPTPTSPAPNQKPAKGYGKRPVWQWVLIYVIVAIIVYGLIYLLFIHKNGSTSSGY